MEKKVYKLPKNAIVVGVIGNDEEVFGRVKRGKLFDLNTGRKFRSGEVVYT